MRTSTTALPGLERWLRPGHQLPSKAPGWAAIKSEAMSLLLWQPQTSDRLYGSWLATTLPPGLPRFSWARHLIFSGRARLALDLLYAQSLPSLCQGWLLRSLAYASLGDLTAAQQAAEHQLSLNPSLVGSRLILAMLHALKGDIQQANAFVEGCDLLEKPLHGFLALDRSSDATHLLQLSVKHRCYTAPVLLTTPFLIPFARMPACLLFRDAMGQALVAGTP